MAATANITGAVNLGPGSSGCSGGAGVGGEQVNINTVSFIDGETGTPAGFSSSQWFSGYVQKGGQFARFGDQMQGIGIVVYGNTGKLSSSTVFYGTLYYYRDADNCSTGFKQEKLLGSITSAPAGSFAVTQVTSNSIQIRLTNFEAQLGNRSVSLSGTIAFTNVPTN